MSGGNGRLVGTVFVFVLSIFIFLFFEEDADQGNTSVEPPCIQCDQMARLFPQYLVIYNNENLPNNYLKLAKAGSRVCQTNRLAKSGLTSCVSPSQRRTRGQNRIIT